MLFRSRQAVSARQPTGGIAPLVTLTAALKFVFLLLGAGCVLLWPLRTFLN